MRCPRRLASFVVAASVAGPYDGTGNQPSSWRGSAPSSADNMAARARHGSGPRNRCPAHRARCCNAPTAAARTHHFDAPKHALRLSEENRGIVYITSLAPRVMSTLEAQIKRSKLDFVLLITLATLWGASYTFIRLGVATIPPLTLIAARTLIAGGLLTVWMMMRGITMPRDRVLWRHLFVQALLNSVVPFTLIAWAERSVEAGLATILNSASPVFAFLATWLITKHEHIAPRKLFGVAAGLAGICLIVGTTVLSGLGKQVVPQLAIVAASVCYAGAAIYSRAFRGLPAVVPAAGSMLLGAALLIPASIVFDHPWTLRPSMISGGALLALAVFSTAAAYVIYFRLVQTLGSVGTTAQAYLRVPIGVALGMLVLGETLAPTAWIGLGCVVTGVAAMTLPQWQTIAARQ